jgi:hypothetical protein
MFDWLVACINTAIGEDKKCAASVGVLDIYGFESFASNDFEQVRACLFVLNVQAFVEGCLSPGSSLSDRKRPVLATMNQ